MAVFQDNNKKKKESKYENINYRYNLKEYFSFLKKYKWLFVFILFLSFIMDITRAADKYSFKVIMDNGAEFIANNLTRSAFVDILLIVGGLFIGIVIIRAAIDWYHIHLVNRLSVKLILDLKRKYFFHILSLSHRFHTTHKTGSLISRLTRSGGAMERMTDVLVFNVSPLLFNLIIVGGSLIYFSVAPAIVVFIITIVFISYSFVILQIQRKYTIKANETEDREKGNVADFFINIDSIKYFGKEKVVNNRFKNLSDNTKKAFLKNWDFYRWMSAGQALILALGTFFLIYFPLTQFLDGDLTLGTLVFIYTIYGNLFWPLFGFVHGIRAYYRSMADFDALFRYGKIENEVNEKKGAGKLEVKQGKIKFNNVTFSYGKRKLFENFNLKIPKGKKVALVGHSGCGKTTLIKLLYRLYDVDSGEITIDNKYIRNVKKQSLREEMSIVPQEAILFDDSIYNNIKFSNPKASKKDVMKAVKFAQLDEFIENLPNKEKTIVGERGVRLSGGEKQRVSIARAILANKKILILDEATSSLDSETEAEIQRDLEKLMENRTSIIIAHRLSTIMKADKIVVMRKGKIVQEGTHRELISEEGEYRRLWNLQKGGYIQ